MNEWTDSSDARFKWKGKHNVKRTQRSPRLCRFLHSLSSIKVQEEDADVITSSIRNSAPVRFVRLK